MHRWRPWFTKSTPSMPAGYVTTYNVTGSAQTLTFVTIRLAGHSERPRTCACTRSG
eukprot:COSAG04_NODE_1543_length_6408_cov_131.251862_8_plen_56_part_00